MTGMVFIVGAGPGDPSLITVKGLNCLRAADTVLYDRLAPPELLHEARAGAELIDVGKTPARHRRSQAEINALLVEHARAGKTVVRLKGGDPFVFGRGGEEGLALREAGIPFEIVPGVTSAIAAPAYAGIPITQRQVAAQFTVVAGHTTDEGAVDWESIPTGGTLVFLMGVKHLPEIVAGLLRRGWPEDTPAALVERGTRPAQRVAESALAGIVAAAADFHPPATLIVGEVVRLRSKLKWFAEGEPVQWG